MGDYVDSKGVGRNYTGYGLDRAAERIDRMPKLKRICFNHGKRKATHIRNSFFAGADDVPMCGKCATVFRIKYPLKMRKDLKFRAI